LWSRAAVAAQALTAPAVLALAATAETRPQQVTLVFSVWSQVRAVVVAAPARTLQAGL
jgi:hypothetical protein